MYKIRYPRDGQTVKVIKSKFVAVGKAPPGHRHLIGVLLKGVDPVAVARTVREPRGPAAENWFMVFDLTGVTWIPSDRFTMVLYQFQGPGTIRQVAPPVHNIG